MNLQNPHMIIDKIAVSDCLTFYGNYRMNA